MTGPFRNCSLHSLIDTEMGRSTVCSISMPSQFPSPSILKKTMGESTLVFQEKKTTEWAVEGMASFYTKGTHILPPHMCTHSHMHVSMCAKIGNNMHEEGRRKSVLILCGCVRGAVTRVHGEAHSGDVIWRDDDLLRQPLCREKDSRNKQHPLMPPKRVCFRSMRQRRIMLQIQSLC